MKGHIRHIRSIKFLFLNTRMFCAGFADLNLNLSDIFSNIVCYCVSELAKVMKPNTQGRCTAYPQDSVKLC